MSFEHNELNKDKNSQQRDKKRKDKRKSKQLAQIDDPKRLKREMRGLRGKQKRKINRLAARYKKKAERKSNSRDERLNKRKTARDIEKDPNERDIHKKYKPTEKKEDEQSIGFSKRLALSVRIRFMKLKNTAKKVSKKTLNILIGLFGGSTILIVFLVSFMAMALIFGGIVSVMLSHPAAIQELAEQNVLGNAEYMGNVSKDVYDDEGNLLVRANANATDGGFDWYGQSDDNFGKGSPKEESESDGSGGKGELTGNSSEEQIWNYLLSIGFSKGAASGIMGNFMQESGLNPKAIQGGGKGPGTGLAQWENSNGGSGRWDKLVAWAKKNGNRDVWAVDTQLDFMVHEIESDAWQQRQFGLAYTEMGVKNAGRGMDAYNYFKKESDPVMAMYVFEKAFERAGKPAYTNRIKYTNEIYAKYNK